MRDGQAAGRGRRRRRRRSFRLVGGRHGRRAHAALRRRTLPRSDRVPAGGTGGGSVTATPRGISGQVPRLHLRRLCKICHCGPGLDRSRKGPSFLLEALSPWVEAKERITDTINRSDGLLSAGPIPGSFLFSLPAPNCSRRESKEPEERVGRNEFYLAREVWGCLFWTITTTFNGVMLTCFTI